MHACGGIVLRNCSQEVQNLHPTGKPYSSRSVLRRTYGISVGFYRGALVDEGADFHASAALLRDEFVVHVAQLAGHQPVQCPGNCARTRGLQMSCSRSCNAHATV